jgi:uncharacterized membrane protein
MTKKGKVLLASAAAGLMTLALTAGAGTAHAQDAGDAKVKCYGVNGCKGTGDCGGKGHACAGKNECKGQGWVYKASADECLKIEGGRLTPEAK